MLSIYPSKLSPLSNEVFFTAGTLHWINGSSLESIKLSQNVPGIYMSGFFLFLVIVIFSITLFCGDFDSSSFSCSNVIVLLIIQEQPFRGVLEKKCSENMQQIYRRIPMPKCGFLSCKSTLLKSHFVMGVLL